MGYFVTITLGYKGSARKRGLAACNVVNEGGNWDHCKIICEDAEKCRFDGVSVDSSCKTERKTEEAEENNEPFDCEARSYIEFGFEGWYSSVCIRFIVMQRPDARAALAFTGVSLVEAVCDCSGEIRRHEVDNFWTEVWFVRFRKTPVVDRSVLVALEYCVARHGASGSRACEIKHLT